MIFEVKTYVDHKGRTLYEKTAVKNGWQEGNEVPFPVNLSMVPKTYRGQGVIQTDSGAIPFPFDFPPGMSLEECFSRYEEFGKKAFDEMQKEASTKIITPDQFHKGVPS